MKSFGSWHSGNHKFHFGYSLTRFGIGVSVDRYSFNLDLAFFWFSIEW